MCGVAFKKRSDALPHARLSRIFHRFCIHFGCYINSMAFFPYSLIPISLYHIRRVFCCYISWPPILSVWCAFIVVMKGCWCYSPIFFSLTCVCVSVYSSFGRHFDLNVWNKPGHCAYSDCRTLLVWIKLPLLLSLLVAMLPADDRFKGVYEHSHSFVHTNTHIHIENVIEFSVCVCVPLLADVSLFAWPFSTFHSWQS